MVIKIRYLNRYFLEFMYYIISKNPISHRKLWEKKTVYIPEGKNKDLTTVIIQTFPPQPPETLYIPSSKQMVSNLLFLLLKI